MMKLNVLLRQTVVFSIKPKLLSRSVINPNSSSSSSSSSSSDDEKKDVVKKRSEEAKRKLDLLLAQMIQKDTTVTKFQSKLELAKPTDRRKQTKDSKNKKIDDPAKQMLGAVKEVAKIVGGDAKQTESELLQKLLNPIKEESATAAPNNLNELFKDMKIERRSKSEQTVSRAQQVKHILQSTKTKQQPTQLKGTVAKLIRKRFTPDQSTEDQLVEERVPLFGKEALNIFPSATEVNTWDEHNLNKTWAALEERELKLATIHPPANYFQQMIQWTEQGKIWRFPIDNEQDLEGEKDLYFTEHVFLEKHIEPWCPTKGPLRHFMELVLVGLSKNPYLTVKDKKEHIEWYKNYFHEKKTLLKEVEAIPADFEIKKDLLPKLES